MYLSQTQIARQLQPETGQLRNFTFNCIKKGSSTFQQKSTPVNRKLFKRYSANLPIGPLEVDSDVSTCEETIHKELPVKKHDIKVQCQSLPFKHHRCSAAKIKLRRRQYHIKKSRKLNKNMFADTLEEHAFAVNQQDINVNDSQNTDTDTDIITSHIYTTPPTLDTIAIPTQEISPYEAVSSGSVVHTKQCAEHVQKARNERDIALHVAKLYRNRIEELVTGKRELQNNLEAKVEHVRDFWRNYIVEGRSRSGRMVYNALLKNEISKN